MNGVRFPLRRPRRARRPGAFLDQRENYAAAAQYAHGEALDVFCYQGGFALHLAQKCSSVTGVDSSRPALEMAEKNAALNGREIEWIEATPLTCLRDYAAGGTAVRHHRPRSSRLRQEQARSGKGPARLQGAQPAGPEDAAAGGILVTCSCSFHVSAAEFLEVVADAARDAHKSLRLLENRGAGERPSNPAECARNELPEVPDITCK